MVLKRSRAIFSVLIAVFSITAGYAGQISPEFFDASCYMPGNNPTDMSKLPHCLEKLQPLYQRRHQALKDLYSRNVYKKNKGVLQIPKKIHQIWIGPKQLPEIYAAYGETWKKHHTAEDGWEYIMWDNEKVAAFEFPTQGLRDAFNAAKNWGEKSDILRYGILFIHGGLYVDTDFECLGPVDDFHYKYSFYAGMAPRITGAFICCALIAAAPGHPVMRRCVMTTHASDTSAQGIDYWKLIIAATGSDFFGNMFYEELMHNPNQDTLIVPTNVFYPLPISAQRLSEKDKRAFIRPESLGVHHWGMTWKAPEATVRS